ncbi:hypothetical protein D9615_002588 [Tricholomella constricta]|uniref:Uncharacterized protein n=1 Tax=Tricholomella constricta TaxID=117010 RepID=A0A8H5M942_9AGAR|nr:hypothetical protein D9615_002588 [Tricholomella constricta]
MSGTHDILVAERAAAAAAAERQRQAGQAQGQQQPSGDTVTDKDASRPLGGSASAEVPRGMGQTGSGMRSEELHQEGQAGRRRDPQMGGGVRPSDIEEL